MTMIIMYTRKTQMVLSDSCSTPVILYMQYVEGAVTFTNTWSVIWKKVMKWPCITIYLRANRLYLQVRFDVEFFSSTVIFVGPYPKKKRSHSLLLNPYEKHIATLWRKLVSVLSSCPMVHALSRKKRSAINTKDIKVFRRCQLFTVHVSRRVIGSQIPSSYHISRITIERRLVWNRIWEHEWCDKNKVSVCRTYRCIPPNLDQPVGSVQPYKLTADSTQETTPSLIYPNKFHQFEN